MLLFFLGTNVQLNVTCFEEYLDIKLIDTLNDSNQCSCSNISVNEELNKIFRTDRRLVARLNDNPYRDKYRQSIFKEIDTLRTYKDKLNICMICSDVSMFPILVSQLGNIFQ